MKDATNLMLVRGFVLIIIRENEMERSKQKRKEKIENAACLIVMKNIWQKDIALSIIGNITTKKIIEEKT